MQRGLKANPKSFPERATPPHWPDSRIEIINSEIFSSAEIDEIIAGIPIPRLTNTGDCFSLNNFINSSITLLAITFSDPLLMKLE